MDSTVFIHTINKGGLDKVREGLENVSNSKQINLSPVFRMEAFLVLGLGTEPVKNSHI